jgi:hypothetical protein
VETIGLYNPTNAAFYLKNTNTSGYADLLVAFGPPGNHWLPIAGDWNGDGVDTVGLYDPTTSKFYLRNTLQSGFADMTFVFGTPNSSAQPVAGDWNGDKTDTVGLYTANEHFALRNSNAAGTADLDFKFSSTSGTGTNTVPLVGDWTAKGTDTVGIYNTSTNQMRIKDANTVDAAITSLYYGSPTTKLSPVVGAWGGTSSLVTRSLSENLLDTLADDVARNS